jgi:twitching motility protein PilT
MSIIFELLKKAVEEDASDIHIKANCPPYFRVHGNLTESPFEAVTPEYMHQITDDIIPEYQQESFKIKHEADFSLQEEGVGRFRVNVFCSQGVPSLVMRYVKSEVPTFDDLQLPEQIMNMAHVERGIILLAGTTGSGKSTTLACIISEINRTQRRRIITVEDPIEYQFTDDQSIISQRELGLDTESFSNALRAVLRQDPDVILVGEMRDEATISTALLAAETGHLVLSTLHAGTTDLAVPRMLDVFPAEEQDQIRMALAGNLHAIICQRLVPAIDGGVCPAVEILINTSTVSKLLEKDQLDTIAAAVETGAEDGMQTFNSSLYDHIKAGRITEAEGMRFATNPESLRMNLQGIFLSEGSRILGS